MADRFFMSRKIFPGTIVITGPGADSYLLLAEDEAVMIDAGSEHGNIRAFAETLTDLPVRKVVNTHSHFDHTAGNGWFDVVYGTEATARSGKNVMGGDPSLYPLDYEYTIVGDGDILPVKGRELEVILLDCHAPGNIAVLDRTRRLLFPGDEVESGQVLLLPGYAEVPGQIHSRPAATVETYRNAMLKLRSRADEFDWILPAHNGTPVDKSCLDTLILLAEKILSGEITGSRDCSSPSYGRTASHFPNDDAGYRRAELSGVSLVYCEKLIFDTDYKNADALPPATRLHVMSAETARQ
ncbi:MAG: MBL fold metallo-hydrolase [Lachnospiraceae bacterium]|nr:MBL fold metallo-hydrolase [Lachnospiraceae bacterium]